MKALRAAGGNTQFEIAAVYVPFAEDSDSDAGGQISRRRRPAGKSAVEFQTAGVAASAGQLRPVGEAPLMASIREVRKTLLPVLIGLVVLDLAMRGVSAVAGGTFARGAAARPRCVAGATGSQAAGSAADARHGRQAETGVDRH